MTYIKDVHDYSSCDSDFAGAAIPEERRKAVTAAIAEIVETEFERLIEEDLAFRLSQVAADRAERFLTRILEGDADAAASLLGDNRGSRYREGGMDSGKPWASLIHGRVFESGAMELRRRIVEAHADLIRDARIVDMESIVAGLTDQVREQDKTIARLRGES